MAYGKAQFANEPGVTPAVLDDFERWHDLLARWNAKINLVSQTALEAFWFRHACDSWQLTAHLPRDAKTILDLGSGGGFPGLALAIYCKHTENGQVTLVESAGKKANFLRAVIRDLSLPAIVQSERAESLEPKPYDVISARAFAPLPRLLGYAAPFWAEDTQGLFLKGQAAEAEIAAARENWSFDSRLSESKTDPEASVLILTKLTPNH